MHAYSTLLDKELADLLRSGDDAAFTIIYKKYWKKLYAIASKRLGNPTEAEEIVQEIFLNLWRKRARLTVTTDFSKYFAVALKFEILDVMRKRANATAYEKEQGFTFSEADENALRQMNLFELQQKLQLTISSLPEKCQLVFRLQQEQGFSQKQIAETLKISEKTVEAHLSKAKKTLKSTFAGLLSFVIFICF